MLLLQLVESWFSYILAGCQAIWAWFGDHATAAAAWLALLIAVSAFVCQLFEGQQVPNASKIDEWTARNAFHQHCQRELDKGVLWNNCNKTLALPVKAPPSTDSDASPQDEEIFPLRHPLAKRTTPFTGDDLVHGMESRLSSVRLEVMLTN